VQREICTLVWRYGLSLVGLELLWLRRFTHEPPGQLSALTEAHLQAETLQALKLSWDVLLRAEDAASSNPAVQGALDAACWTSCVWPRELLVGCAEADFQRVPDDVLRELQHRATCFTSSVLVERSFNWARDRLRHNKSGALGARQAYHLLLGSPLLAEHGRPDSPPEDDWRAHPATQQVPLALFEAKSNTNPSVSEQVLTDLMEGTEARTSSNAWLQGHLAWQALLNYVEHWEGLDRCWLSLLARRHQLLNKAGRTWVVCEATQWGLLALPVRFEKRQGKVLMRWVKDSSGRLCHDQLWVDSLEGWKARDVEVATPEEMKKLGEVGIIATVVESRRSLSLLQAAAEDAFRGLSMHWLRRLLLEHAGRQPAELARLEEELVEQCLRWALPAADDAEVRRLLQLRHARPRPAWASALTPQNVEVLAQEGAANVEDERGALQARAKAYQERAKPQPREPAPVAATDVPLQAAPASSSPDPGEAVVPVAAPAAPWRELPGLPEGVVDQPMAKSFCPPGKGCSISVHKNSAWLVKYPVGEGRGPKSRYVAFAPGEAESSRQALLECLRWAWQRHEEQSGLPAPFNLHD